MSTQWTPPAGSGRRPADPRRRTTVLVIVALAVVIFLVRTGHLSTFWLIYYAMVIPSVILHEISHGVVANALGDDTAKRAGRLTLNPLAHIDPMGSIVVPALLVLASGIPFGWAKPVPVNVGRLRRPRNGSVWVSLAGPATNGMLFVVTALAFRTLVAHGVGLTATTSGMPIGYEFLFAAGLANITLGVFNLIPIPPLDGSAVVERLVPSRHLHRYYQLRPYGMVIVFVFALFVLRGTAVGAHLFNAETHLWSSVSGVRA